MSSIAKDKNTPRNGGKYSPIISEKVKQKTAAGGKVAVLIKLKQEWEHPSVKKMTTASDPAHFISKQDIKKLQRALESSFTPEENQKDINIIHKLDNIPWITGKINQKALEKLKVHPNVAIIAEDASIKLHLAESGPSINADSSHSEGFTGNGVTVAVIDTGIDTNHPDLDDDLIWEECFLFFGGCPKSGTNRASGPGSAEDGYGHGTHVSGIITSGNTTYNGIAPDAKVVALKVLDDNGEGWFSDTITAVDWIVSNKDIYSIDVVNMSLGTSNLYSGICDSNYSAAADAADAAKAAGIVIFASSGNDQASNGMNLPACLTSVISVGSVYDANAGPYWGSCFEQTSKDKISCFSNVSSELDLLAPGSKIDSSHPGGGIINASGTSMASPHAAATAALMLQKNPFLTPDDIGNILVNSGEFIYDARIDMAFPRIDSLEALYATPDSNPILTILTAGTGSGSVTGAGTYNYRDIATVTATPESGSIFDGWSGPDAAECSTGSLSMTANKSCSATFTIDNCPSDPLKIEPGICGCGVADTDTDSDGTRDCYDDDDDGDGMPDFYEIDHGLNPLDALDANEDPDGDKLTNLEEYKSDTDPYDIDTDNDGIADNFDGYPLNDQQNSCIVSIQNELSLENFTTLQAAIDDPNAIDNDIINIAIADFEEDILYDRNIILKLSGGYFCDFSYNPSISFLNKLTIRNGTIIIENLIIY